MLQKMDKSVENMEVNLVIDSKEIDKTGKHFVSLCYILVFCYSVFKTI